VIVNAMIGRKEYTDIGLLQLLCSTPDMLTALRPEKRHVPPDRFLADHGMSSGWRSPGMQGEEFDRSLKTALLLSDWADESAKTPSANATTSDLAIYTGMVEGIAWLIQRESTPGKALCAAPREGRSRRWSSGPSMVSEGSSCLS